MHPHYSRARRSGGDEVKSEMILSVLRHDLHGAICSMAQLKDSVATSVLYSNK